MTPQSLAHDDFDPWSFPSDDEYRDGSPAVQLSIVPETAAVVAPTTIPSTVTPKKATRTGGKHTAKHGAKHVAKRRLVKPAAKSAAVVAEPAPVAPPAAKPVVAKATKPAKPVRQKKVQPQVVAPIEIEDEVDGWWGTPIVKVAVPMAALLLIPAIALGFGLLVDTLVWGF